MAEGTVQTIEIAADRETIFGIAADVASYPAWAQGVRSVDVLGEDSEGRPARATFVLDGMMKPITYTLVYTYDEPDMISWEAEPGSDIKSMKGSYKFSPIDRGTEVVYALRVELGFTLPGFVRRQAERQITGVALRGLKKQAETASE